MSRTDKDAPCWVTATWWEPTHMNCPDPSAIGRPGTRVCDLPDRPHVKTARDRQPWRHCHWTVICEHRYPTPRHDILHMLYQRPQRRQVQQQCRRAVAEYRGSAVVDTDVTTRQVRLTHWVWR